jgi:hypothetical protein
MRLMGIGFQRQMLRPNSIFPFENFHIKYNAVPQIALPRACPSDCGGRNTPMHRGLSGCFYFLFNQRELQPAVAQVSLPEW